MEKIDYILQHCCIDDLKTLVVELEGKYEIKVIKDASIGLTMIKAQDSVEAQDFYLGEALTSDCEVCYKEFLGYGYALGDEPLRAYCVAVVDALLNAGEGKNIIEPFLAKHDTIITQKEKIEYNHIQRTRVDFKMMEQA